MAGGGEHGGKRQKTNKNWGSKHDNKAKYRAQARAAGGGVISASGLLSGDVGIFVTSDKGKEKASLREIEDLLSEEMELGLEATGDQRLNEGNGHIGENDEGGEESVNQGSGDNAKPETPEGGGIEDAIQKELAELAGSGVVSGTKRKRGPASKHDGTDGQDGGQSSKKLRLDLVTLDIPCVSFVRFPPNTNYDPVALVTKLCRDAKANPERQRSRYIKRLTPLSKVRKVMSGGLEELCRDILPAVFAASEESPGYKYAVRAGLRNNNQIKREEVINIVAGAVRELGLTGEDSRETHKVDLKGFEKLVLVEVYRNVVGMSVVDSEWETLRRFNLAEIYADGRKEAEEGNDGGVTGGERMAKRQSNTTSLFVAASEEESTVA